MKASTQHPFKGFKAYGPYLSKTENRRVIVLVPINESDNLKRTTISYARFKYSQKIGAPVSKEFEVDHIDNDKLNDELSNLQLLAKADNTRKSHPGSSTLVELECPICNKKFVRRRGQTHLRYPKTSSSQNKTCCSRECGYKQTSITLRSKKQHAPVA